MEDNMKEFIAYSRKLLRSLTKLKKLLDDAEYDEAKQMLKLNSCLYERTCG